MVIVGLVPAVVLDGVMVTEVDCAVVGVDEGEASEGTAGDEIDVFFVLGGGFQVCSKVLELGGHGGRIV